MKHLTICWMGRLGIDLNLLWAVHSIHPKSKLDLALPTNQRPWKYLLFLMISLRSDLAGRRAAIRWFTSSTKCQLPTYLGQLFTPPQIAVAAHVNLIDSIFQKLTTLYFKSSMKVSAQYVIGQLLGTEAAPDQMIGSVVPLAELENLCESAVSYSNILVRWDACSCRLFSVR